MLFNGIWHTWKKQHLWRSLVSAHVWHIMIASWLHHFRQEKWAFQCKVVVAECKSRYCPAVTAQQETVRNHMQCNLTMVDSELCGLTVLLDKQSKAVLTKEFFFLPWLICACCQNRNSTNECRSTHDIANNFVQFMNAKTLQWLQTVPFIGLHDYLKTFIWQLCYSAENPFKCNRLYCIVQ